MRKLVAEWCEKIKCCWWVICNERLDTKKGTLCCICDNCVVWTCLLVFNKNGILLIFVCFFFFYILHNDDVYYLFMNFSDDIYLPPSKLLDIATTCCEKHFDDVKNQTTIACLKNSMNSFASDVANIAQCIQEAESTMPSPISDEQVKVIWC